MLLPLTFWMFLEERNSTSGKRFLIFSVTALMIGGICFLPVIHRYGLDSFTFYDNSEYPSVTSLIRKGILEVWGVPATLGFLGLCCLAPFIFQDIRGAFIQPHVRRGLVLSSLAVLLYIVAFLRLPHEAAYLIPVVPFLLLSVSLLIPPYFVRCFAIILLLSSFFITIDRSGVTLPGPVMRDHWMRELRLQETKKIIETVAHLFENSVIVVGARLPQIRAVLNAEHQNTNVALRVHTKTRTHEYVYLIEDADTYRRYVEQGRRVYFVRGLDVFNLRAHRVDLRQLGAQQLDALDEK